MRYVVLTVPERKHYIEKLKEQIPELEVFEDTNKEKFEYICKVWNELQNDEIIWLEDDVILCDNFKERINNELNFFGRNNTINFFYSGNDNTSFTQKLNGKRFLWNQCNFYPKGYTKKFLDFYNIRFKKFTHFDPSNFNYDNCIAHTLDYHKDFYYLCRPNLVQHMDIQSSINDNRDKERISKYFINDLDIPYIQVEKGKHIEYIQTKWLFANLNDLRLKKGMQKLSKHRDISLIKKYKLQYESNPNEIPNLYNLDFQYLLAMFDLKRDYIPVFINKII